jgi:uncharacterized protein VirK/YbjX
MTMLTTLRQRRKMAAPAYDLWAALWEMPLRKKFLYSLLFARHLHTLMPLLLAPRGSNVRRLLNAHPEILVIMVSRYMAANWDTRTRVARLIDHHRTVAEIGGAVDCAPNTIVDLLKLPSIDLQYRITLDQPRWLLREGSLVMSLWDGVDRIFHLGFCLSNKNGRRIAYIGSLQGRVETDIHKYTIDILNRYRQFTKAACGMRPRDFLVEVFKMFCMALDINEIRAVSDINRPLGPSIHDVKLSYDEIWIERGGKRADDGFFLLLAAAGRRVESEIPAKKRALYARRYAMLEAIETELNAAVHSSLDHPAPVTA